MYNIRINDGILGHQTIIHAKISKYINLKHQKVTSKNNKDYYSFRLYSAEFTTEFNRNLFI